MKKTVVIGEKNYEIRGLTWGEKKQLKTEGHDVTTLDPEKDNDELVERIITMTCENADDIDTLDIVDVYHIFFEIVQLSFTGDKDAKN